MDVLTLVLVVACLLLFLGLLATTFGEPVSRPIVYSRDQLLALSNSRVLPEEGHEIPKELWHRRRGCRAGAKYRERRRRNKRSIPSILMGNVRSLPNKMEELMALTRLQWEYQQSSLLLFTETWLMDHTPDSVVTLDGFQLLRTDRSMRESGKRRGGGLAMYVNKRWCNPEHITVKEQRCIKDIELLALSIRPYHLAREFSNVLMLTVYIPPSADAMAACEDIHTTVSQLQMAHPQSLIIISGDFNHATLSTTLPNFSHYVDCHTRDKKILTCCLPTQMRLTAHYPSPHLAPWTTIWLCCTPPTPPW